MLKSAKIIVPSLEFIYYNYYNYYKIYQKLASDEETILFEKFIYKGAI